MLQHLLVIRHGKAVESHPQGDRHRELSAVGRDRIARMLPELRAHGFVADLGLCSPYIRARQTAELFFAELQPARRDETRNLTPDADGRELMIELEAWQSEGVSSAVLVSHNPFVSDVTQWLVEPAAKGQVHFQTPSLWALEFPRGLAPHQGRVLWVMHP